MDQFVPIDVPERRLDESLLWHLHKADLCCAVAGPFAAYMAVRFKQGETLGLYFITCIGHETKVSRMLFLYREAYIKFNIGLLTFEWLPSRFYPPPPSDAKTYLVQDFEVTVTLVAIPIERGLGEALELT
jgi:hypothetical protein